MGFKIVGDSTEERFFAEVVAQHSDDGATLKIANMVEDLVNLERVFHWNFNRMRCTQGIELECGLDSLSLLNTDI